MASTSDSRNFSSSFALQPSFDNKRFHNNYELIVAPPCFGVYRERCQQKDARSKGIKCFDCPCFDCTNVCVKLTIITMLCLLCRNAEEIQSWMWKDLLINIRSIKIRQLSFYLALQTYRKTYRKYITECCVLN